MFLLSVVCVYLSFMSTTNLYYLFALIVPLAWVILLIVKKKYILLITSILLFSFLSIYTICFINNYSSKDFENKDLSITARIEDINKVNNTFSYLTLSHIEINNNPDLNSKIKGNISVGISNYSQVEYDIGYFLTFNCKLEAVDLIVNNSVNSIYLKNNIRYIVTENITITQENVKYGKKYFNEIFKEYNNNLLVENLGEDEGNISFAVLFGDRSNVNENIMSIFKYSGIMHIFAVSGLHIGLIVSLLYFLLKKLRVNNKLKLVISSIVLFLYCYLCSFSAPVVRASIMCLVALFAKVVGKRNDPITTLSVSGLILLAIKPLNLFDAGFQMTFIAVFGILLFGDLFKRVKIKNKILKTLFLSVSVSLSTQLAMLPILAKYYGYYTTWSLLSNLISLPIFTIFYTILFIFNLIILILPFMSFLLFLPKALLNLLIFINLQITNLPYGIIKVYPWGFFATIFYYIFMFSVSKYLLLKSKFKISVSLILATISIVLLSFNSLPLISKENKLYFYEKEDSGYSTLLTTKNNNFYLLNPDFSSQRSINKIKEDLKNKKINKISGIILISDYVFEASRLITLLEDFNTKFYLPKNHNAISNLKLLNTKIEEIEFNNKIDLGGVYLTYYDYNNSLIATEIILNNKKYLEIDEKMLTLNLDFKEYLKTNLNFWFDCVKINNAEDMEYLNILNSKIFITNQNGSFC